VDSILEFKQVSKSYGKVQALQALSFLIPENKIVGLIGANGAGKSTAMRLIVRYLRPDSGDIYFKGTPIHELKNEAFPIAYIPDAPICYDELSVSEHLAFVSAMYRTEARKAPLVHRLQLEEHLDKVPSMLSKGNKQKLSIACALLRDYEVLMADEPFTGLDPRQIKVFKDILLENKESGKTVILSTHLLDMIESLCDEFIMIDHGELLVQGSFDKIINDNPMCASLEELYLHLSNKDNRADEGASQNLD